MVVPFAFDTQGGLHPNWRIIYKLWAERWASFGECRSEMEQATLVNTWISCTSVAVQRARYRLVRRVRDKAMPGSFNSRCACRGATRRDVLTVAPREPL